MYSETGVWKLESVRQLQQLEIRKKKIIQNAKRAKEKKTQKFKKEKTMKKRVDLALYYSLP